MTPNDHLKKQGWKEMKILLDQEMPIKKSNRRFILLIFWSIGFIVLATMTILWLTHNPETNKISKSETDEMIASTSTKSGLKESIFPSQIETLNANTIKIKNQNVEQITNSDNISTKNFENKKSKTQIPIFISDQFKNNDSQIQSKNNTFKEKPISILHELKANVDITQKNEQEEKTVLIESLIQNERQPLTIAYIGTEVSYPISQKINDSLALSINQNLSSSPLTSKKQNTYIGLALGIGQNLTIKSNNNLQLGLFFEKSINHKHGIIFTSSIDISRMDLKVKIDTMNSSLSTQLENYVGNSNNLNLDNYFNVNTFNPGFLVQSTSNLSYVRHLNNKFYFQGGIEISYLIDIQEKNSGLEKDRNLGISNEYGKSNLNKLQSIIYNKWDIAPTLGLGYKFTKNISISTQYRHGLVSLIKYPIGSNDYIYFRNLYAKLNYTF